MNRSSRVVRASFYLSIALPLAVLACGQEFSAGSGDGGEDGGGIVFGDGGGGHDASTTQEAGEDSGPDARSDGPEQADAKHDGAGMPESGVDGHVIDAGGGCPTGFLTCSDGGCAQEGPTNCGSCGNDCTMLPNVQNAKCPSGQCVFACLPGWQHCTSSPNDGCETNITKSPNCGACNVDCTGGTPVCSSTGCVSGCMAGQTLCNGNTCVNTTNDPQNCNGCNSVCPAGPANSQPTCTNSVCGWSCTGGYSQCSSSCFNESNDTSHCGSCTTVCSGATNGQAECNDGGCTVACNAGLTYCPNNAACNDLQNDTNNCGMCNHLCPAGPPNSTTTCGTGMCGWSCNPNYEQCGNSCVLSVPDAVHGVFVAQGGANTSCGVESAPCGSITAGLTAAQQSGGSKNIVYVAESATPYVEAVTLIAGVTIQGGWVYSGNGVWSHPCTLDPSQVVIQAPVSATGNSAVVSASYTGSSTLDTLTISNTPSVAAPGQTLVGLFASGAQTQVVLQNVKVETGTAGAGAGGSTGQGGTGAVSCTTSGDSAAGGIGMTGLAGGAGSYGASGYTPGAQGGIGLTGDAGDNGGNGKTGGSCTVTRCQIICSNPPTCNVYDCTDETNSPTTGGTGSPGCGGNGGLGGTGGFGGGSSIAVFINASTVAFGAAVTLAPGNGGGGGPGAGGGQGALGVTGATGSSQTCNQGYCASANSTTCTANGTTTAAGGAGGTAGGKGGQGGTGGGGAGGDSYCYFKYGGGTASGAPTCTPASGGAAGTPNGAAGTGLANN